MDHPSAHLRAFGGPRPLCKKSSEIISRFKDSWKVVDAMRKVKYTDEDSLRATMVEDRETCFKTACDAFNNLGIPHRNGRLYSCHKHLRSVPWISDLQHYKELHTRLDTDSFLRVLEFHINAHIHKPHYVFQIVDMHDKLGNVFLSYFSDGVVAHLHKKEFVENQEKSTRTNPSTMNVCIFVEQFHLYISNMSRQNSRYLLRRIP